MILAGIDESGYRLITNCNKNGGQEIDYLHFHLVGGVRLGKMISLPKQSKKQNNPKNNPKNKTIQKTKQSKKQNNPKNNKSKFNLVN
jgi:diadenosine tetraphosphate (Ap4A) HIT family hydrolase